MRKNSTVWKLREFTLRLNFSFYVKLVKIVSRKFKKYRTVKFTLHSMEKLEIIFHENSYFLKSTYLLKNLSTKKYVIDFKKKKHSGELFFETKKFLHESPAIRLPVHSCDSPCQTIPNLTGRGVNHALNLTFWRSIMF